MNKKQQELFLAFFEQILQAQIAYEQIKKKMRLCRDFNPSLLFKQVSQGNHTIQIPQLRSYLSDKLTCNQLELYELFEKLDLSRNGYISLGDFAREVTPVNEQVNLGKGEGVLSVEVQGYFLSLIMEYVKRFRILEQSRKQVYFIEPYRAFGHIDTYKTGLIGPGQLSRFFQANDFDIAPYQLVLLMHGLRRRCYLQVNLQVFCQSLDPMQFGGYDAYKANIEKQAETQFLRRSRREEEIMRRSRIEQQKISHELNKSQRRLRADVERNLDVENRISDEVRYHQLEQERLLRRRILEEDKNVRWNAEMGGSILQAQRSRYLADRVRNTELQILRNQQKDVQSHLARSALVRQAQLQNSRRVRNNLELERQLTFNAESAIQKRLLHQEIQRDRYQARLRALQSKQVGKQKQRGAKLQLLEQQRNKRLYERQLQLQRDRIRRQMQLQRPRFAQSSNVKPYNQYNNPSAAKNQYLSAYRSPYQTQAKSQLRTAQRSQYRNL